MINIIFYTPLLLILFLFGCDSKLKTMETLNVSLSNGEPLKIQGTERGRFLLVNNPTTVIDTVTGQVWIAKGPANNGTYYFVKMCYRDPKSGALMPTPYENELTHNLSEFTKECNMR